ncbi:ABC transporter ATP-binding protein [Burkholderia vietnamiensis]|uniref:ABC transporter ATP-binding protein n=1 Tax=Burkholderia vietnamiensis TaxID=60552 RepID=UPI00075892CB|nr:ABC transporter ATP-binding protein [Burkholderia vietnamiensis]KVF72082.1 multidrug ABC transporter ATP-binding protein [Burkholderia vietnamiensis]KVF77115.1 multidrug ABC transporter ATP-binding protein [Burkholderia vietnamiensis]KVF87928.1 multidrug ABC transporter ATP-binding protein [Burkholderia vietnamiensis]KVF90362.1 multidrug ABC transporter ATP-binding protein [Burkholderia vietnamiensis]KVF99964.1 multidrug ABC transporter ATP-binding protein [Burkholderia vietnamiensis]
MFSWFERRLPTFPLDDPVTPPKGFFSFVWACTKGARGWLLLIALTSAALAGYEAALFAMMGRVVDWLSSATPANFGGRHFGTLVGFAAILAASALLIALHTLVKHQVLAINFPMRLRWLFHRLMLDQSLSFYANEFAGRVTTKIMQTALAVRDALFMSVDVVIGVAAYLIGILALAASFDWRLMIPLALWALGYGAACAFFVPRLGRVGSEQADARALMTGRITDAYSNITTVKLFSHTRREADHARHAMEAFKATGDAQMRLVSAFEIVNHLLSTLLLVGSTGLALYLWLHGEASAGVVAAVVAMALRLSSYSHWIMWEMTELFENVGTIQDGINTLTKVRSVRDAPDATALTVPRGEIVFDNVRFAHEEHDTPVFDGLNLTIRPGERIGLIGRSGAGKSTLVNLLLRFYDVDGGSIRIDGQDIAHVTQDSLRAAIGMVTQDTSLLHRTMRENILYGRPDATEREMREAAVRAEAADFIAQLRDRHGRSGYDVEVGERGVKLSGGQRQRVAIARVMLKDAPILVLDEATSALDSEVEVAIQRSLDSLMSGKTVIAIAHRLSTIAAMDRLIVLDAGRIVEVGTHAELLQRGGIYAALWAHQSGGFLGETAEAQRETQ